jgi:hypothetical protein
MKTYTKEKVCSNGAIQIGLYECGTDRWIKWLPQKKNGGGSKKHHQNNNYHGLSKNKIKKIKRITFLLNKLTETL